MLLAFAGRRRFAHGVFVSIDEQLKRCTKLSEVESLVLLRDGKFNDVNCASLFRVLGKFNCTNPHVLERITQITKQQPSFRPRAMSQFCCAIATGKLIPNIPDYMLDRMRLGGNEMFHGYLPRQISSLVWAFAKLNQVKEFQQVVRPHMLGVIEEKIKEFNPQDLTTTLWSFATMGDPSVCNMIAQEICRRNSLRGFSAQDFSNTLWSMASMLGQQQQQHDVHVLPLLLDVLERELPQLELEKFSPQALANSVWGFAKLGREEIPSVLLHQVAQRDLNEFDSHSLLNILWALTTSNNADRQVVNRVCGAFQPRDLSVMSPKDFALVVWSLATLKCLNKTWDLFMQEIVQGERALADFTTQDLSMMLWAFAAVGNCDLVGERFARELSLRMETFPEYSTQALSTMFWSLAVLRYRNAELNEQICNELATRNFAKFNANDLLLVAKALALFGMSHKRDVMQRLMEQVIATSSTLSQRYLITVLWSCACLDLLCLAQSLVHCIAPQGDGTAEGNTQLFQVGLAWKQTFPKDKLPHVFTAMSMDVSKQVQQQLTTSTRQTRVAALLQHHFPNAGELIQEAIVLNGISVDILLPAKKHIVEVDGPQHFFQNSPRTPTGATEFKLRLLRNAGFHVHSISAVDFTNWTNAEREANIAALAVKISAPFQWSVATTSAKKKRGKQRGWIV